MMSYQINILVPVEWVNESFGHVDRRVGELVRLVPIPVEVLTQLNKKMVKIEK